jgi:hypothetical protein
MAAWPWSADMPWECKRGLGVAPSCVWASEVGVSRDERDDSEETCDGVGLDCAESSTTESMSVPA